MDSLNAFSCKWISLIFPWKLLYEVRFLEKLTQSLNFQLLFYHDCAAVLLVPALFLLYLQGKLGVLIIPFHQDVIHDYFGTEEQWGTAKCCRRSKGEAFLREAEWAPLSGAELYPFKWEKQFRSQGGNKTILPGGKLTWFLVGFTKQSKLI